MKQREIIINDNYREFDELFGGKKVFLVCDSSYGFLNIGKHVVDKSCLTNSSGGNECDVSLIAHLQTSPVYLHAAAYRIRQQASFPRI